MRQNMKPPEKVMVTGADGMLGVDMVRHLRKGPYKVMESTINDLDITRREEVRESLLTMKPDFVIHTAAYTDVDRAETEVEAALEVNFKGTLHLASACAEIKAGIIYISTDYVFNGEKRTPYVETDDVDPVNFYGYTKMLGERAVTETVNDSKICRTSWLIGPYGIGGPNFVDKILSLADEGKKLKVVDDQKGRPSFTFDLALLVEQIMNSEACGIFHCTNSGECSWFELAKAALELSGRGDTKIIPVSSKEFPRPARRPRNSRLDSSRLEQEKIEPLRHWREALKDYIEIIQERNKD